MKWDDQDSGDARVVSQGRWCDIRSICKVFPSSPGVYLFADESLDVKFIGCSKELGLQNAAQDSVYKEENYGAKRTLWLATENREEAQHLRRQLVKKYLARKKRINES
jgi:excinuclease UvrABC nuclease subunit